MTNTLAVILIAGFSLLILILTLMPFAPIIGAWLRSRRPAPTCGNCRYFVERFSRTYCDRLDIWRLRTDQKCNIGEVRE